MDSELFKTNNTPLAAFLVTMGYSILDVIYEGRIGFFLFANNDSTLDVAVKDFQLLRTVNINPQQLISNYRELVERTKRGI